MWQVLYFPATIVAVFCISATVVAASARTRYVPHTEQISRVPAPASTVQDGLADQSYPALPLSTSIRPLLLPASEIGMHPARSGSMGMETKVTISIPDFVTLGELLDPARCSAHSISPRTGNAAGGLKVARWGSWGAIGSNTNVRNFPLLCNASIESTSIQSAGRPLSGGMVVVASCCGAQQGQGTGRPAIWMKVTFWASATSLAVDSVCRCARGANDQDGMHGVSCGQQTFSGLDIYSAL